MAVDVWDLSDEELEAAFREAKAQENSPESGLEDADNYEDDVVDNEEEIEVDSMEHPDEQDSDDDTSLDDDEEEESEDDSEEVDGEPDEEPEVDEEQTDEDDDASKSNKQPTDEVLKFRANGQDYEFTLEEMKGQFGKVFGQAMDYTKKMQALKPHRKTIDAIENAGLDANDVNFMIDALKGDKGAIAELLKRTGIDAFDLDTENTNYVAKDYGRDETELDIKEIVDDISRDKEYNVTHNILDKQWDDRSRGEFVKDPNLIRLLHTDVKSGMFDIVNPIAQKLKVYDGAKQSDLDYYKQAAEQYFSQQTRAQAENEAKAQAAAEKAAAQERNEAERVSQAKARQERQKATKQASAKRKAAAPTRKAAGTKKGVDYLDDSDEAFEEWYSKLQESL